MDSLGKSGNSNRKNSVPLSGMKTRDFLVDPWCPCTRPKSLVFRAKQSKKTHAPVKLNNNNDQIMNFHDFLTMIFFSHVFPLLQLHFQKMYWILFLDFSNLQPWANYCKALFNVFVMLLLTFLLLHFYSIHFNSSVSQQVKEYKLLPLLLLLSVYSRL